jgi:protein transport protein SEC23
LRLHIESFCVSALTFPFYQRPWFVFYFFPTRPISRAIKILCPATLSASSEFRTLSRRMLTLFSPRSHACCLLCSPSAVDYRAKTWTCPFCLGRNMFPPHYAENISPESSPAELVPQFTTVEYQLQTTMPGAPPIFLFVVDTCVDEEELEKLGDALLQAFNLLPPEALVGLITYGTLVNVHELGFGDCPKSFVFRGDKEYSPQKIQDMLGISSMRAQAGGAGMPGGRGSAFGRFLLPASDCAFALEQVLQDLQKDPWPVEPAERVHRSTGVALSVAMGLLESCKGAQRQGSRIVTFIAGPCTIGEGQIVGLNKSETIRSHTDMTNKKVPHYAPACAYYNVLGDRAIAIHAVVDVYACSLDQTGVLELKGMVNRTGGVVVISDKFNQSMFRESLKRAFRASLGVPAAADGSHPAIPGSLAMGFGATIEVIVPRDIKICGALGPCASMRKAGPTVSETETGVGGTSQWYLGGIDPAVTMAFYFDVPNTNPAPLQPNKRRFFQFLTQYQTASGHTHLRVTTTAGPWHSDAADHGPIARSFDQEAAVALIARLVTFRAESEPLPDVLRWLDRSLIRLCSKFATYQKDNAASFRLTPEFQLYPQFMFHLRRSRVVHNNNSSPDEQYFYRQVLNRECVSNTLIMLQPSLMSYTLQPGPPQPVLLDANSVRLDTILLLDTFFHVVVFHGETIAAWKDAGYQNQPEHINFRNLLEAPQNDAGVIMENRFPLPRYISCNQGKSEARFLLSVLNPSMTHHSGEAAGGQTILSDDVSLKVFIEHLIKLSVQS